MRHDGGRRMAHLFRAAFKRRFMVIPLASGIARANMNDAMITRPSRDSLRNVPESIVSWIGSRCHKTAVARLPPEAAAETGAQQLYRADFAVIVAREQLEVIPNRPHRNTCVLDVNVPQFTVVEFH